MPKKILFAFPQENFHLQAEGFFRRDEFELLHAHNTQEALELIADEEPALAFLAHDLPPAGGDACCRQVKKDFLLRHVRLALLDSSEVEDSERCRESGADVVISWPADWCDLLTNARRMLNLPDPDRLAPRAEVSLPVFYRRLLETNRYQGATFNLSTGGLFICAQRLFPRESLLEIELDLSSVGQPPLHCKARVAWINHPEWINKPLLPAGMGLELVDLPLDIMARLESVVAGVLSCSAEL